MHHGRCRLQSQVVRYLLGHLVECFQRLRQQLVECK